jgi:hypothetical protein
MWARISHDEWGGGKGERRPEAAGNCLFDPLDRVISLG